MDGLDHPDPIADLEQWSDNIDEFMEGLCKPLPPYLVNDFWQQSNDIGLRIEMGLSPQNPIAIHGNTPRDSET